MDGLMNGQTDRWKRQKRIRSIPIGFYFDGQNDGWTDRWTERRTNKRTDWQRDRHMEVHKDLGTEGQKNWFLSGQTDR